MFYLGLRPRVSYSAQQSTSAKTGQLLLLLLLLQDNMSPGLERQVIGRLLVLQVFPQASPELEGHHLQTLLHGLLSLHLFSKVSFDRMLVATVLEDIVGQDACSHHPRRYGWTGCL